MRISFLAVAVFGFLIAAVAASYEVEKLCSDEQLTYDETPKDEVVIDEKYPEDKPAYSKEEPKPDQPKPVCDKKKKNCPYKKEHHKKPYAPKCGSPLLQHYTHENGKKAWIMLRRLFRVLIRGNDGRKGYGKKASYSAEKSKGGNYAVEASVSSGSAEGKVTYNEKGKGFNFDKIVVEASVSTNSAEGKVIYNQKDNKKVYKKTHKPPVYHKKQHPKPVYKKKTHKPVHQKKQKKHYQPAKSVSSKSSKSSASNGYHKPAPKKNYGKKTHGRDVVIPKSRKHYKKQETNYGKPNANYGFDFNFGGYGGKKSQSSEGGYGGNKKSKSSDNTY